MLTLAFLLWSARTVYPCLYCCCCWDCGSCPLLIQDRVHWGTQRHAWIDTYHAGDGKSGGGIPKSRIFTTGFTLLAIPERKWQYHSRLRWPHEHGIITKMTHNITCKFRTALVWLVYTMAVIVMARSLQIINWYIIYDGYCTVETSACCWVFLRGNS